MIFCIGGGESLKGFDFNRLDKYNTIGCNHVGFQYKELKNLVFLDEKFYKKNKDNIDKFKGHIYCHIRAVPEGFKLDNMTLIETHYKEPFYNLDNIYLGGISGLTALDIACYNAYINEEIYLLGYDLYGGHFYQDKIPEEDKDMSVWEEPIVDVSRWVSKFALFEKYAKKYGSKIVNCNPESRIRCFEFADIDEVLKKDSEDHLIYLRAKYPFQYG